MEKFIRVTREEKRESIALINQEIQRWENNNNNTPSKYVFDFIINLTNYDNLNLQYIDVEKIKEEEQLSFIKKIYNEELSDHLIANFFDDLFNCIAIFKEKND